MDTVHTVDGVMRVQLVSMSFPRMVGEDRASSQAADMEKELLRHCIAKEYGNTRNDGVVTNEDGRDTNESSSTLLSNLQPPVEAYWDEL